MAVAKKKCDSLGASLRDKDVVLSVTHAALTAVVRGSYDPAYGARPVERFVDRVIGTQLSRLLVGGELKEASTVVVDHDATGFLYTVDAKASSAAANGGDDAAMSDADAAASGAQAALRVFRGRDADAWAGGAADGGGGDHGAHNGGDWVDVNDGSGGGGAHRGPPPQRRRPSP